MCNKITFPSQLHISSYHTFSNIPPKNSCGDKKCVYACFRLSLLEEWKGIRDEELSKLSGIAGCIFVHASGFIGGNNTYEGALEMARRALQGKPTLA